MALADDGPSTFLTGDVESLKTAVDLQLLGKVGGEIGHTRDGHVPGCAVDLLALGQFEGLSTPRHDNPRLAPGREEYRGTPRVRLHVLGAVIKLPIVILPSGQSPARAATIVKDDHRNAGLLQALGSGETGQPGPHYGDLRCYSPASHRHRSPAA